MFATIRRIALALAGAGALIAAGRARADHDLARQPGFAPDVQAPAYPREYPVPTYRAPAPVVRLSLALPAPPVWLAVAPPPPPAYGPWNRAALEREVRWLERVRVRFYRYGAWSPWRVRQFEAWYHARRAELDRRATALAWAPGRGWHAGWGRGPGWDGVPGWDRGRADRDRWERD